MTGLKARILGSTFAAAALSAVAFVAPGTASAACSGANIKGNGSSLQAAAQQKYWAPAFNGKCSPTNEQVEYESTSSGKGLASWWVGHSEEKYKGFGASNAFVGTDQPPNAKQESEILEKGIGSKPIVLSIPVLQAAVALPIHLPEGCTATSGKGKKTFGRLVLDDEVLQKIFAAEITKWSEIGTFNEDKLKCATKAEEESAIIRVVRKEGSGTTAIVKKFLFEINKSPVDGSETWNELAEQNENLNWPSEGTVVRAEKGSGIASTVATTPGSIGYANLNEVRANAAFTPAGGGGAGTSIFWPELQIKGKKFEDPATNGEENAPANANCADEDYVNLNGVGKSAKFPPESTEDVWNEVTASTSQKKSYPLCGFTYDVSLTDFENFSEEAHPTSAAEVETVKNYLSFVLSSEGQKLLESHDFLGLPEAKKESANVLIIARKGAEKIAFG
jgi:ABC-type phosphate transport system substrate-binding protein